MAKMLEATCDAAGKVTALGVVVDVAVVISEGKQASSGVLILDGAKATYIASSATDVKTTIEKLVSVIDDLNSSLTEVTTAFTSIGAVVGPGWVPPPSLATAAANITAKVVTLTATKATLNTLKGALK